MVDLCLLEEIPRDAFGKAHEVLSQRYPADHSADSEDNREDTPEDDREPPEFYHRQDYDLAVARVDPAQHAGVRDSLLQSFSPAAVTLGALQRLPLEIIFEICAYSDIASVFALRHVNRRFSQIVSQVRPYQVLVLHALDTLCILLRSELAQHFTLQDLVEVLYTENCSFCGSFGGFIFLPTLSRCCFPCVGTPRPVGRELRVIDHARLSELLPEVMKSISVPVMKTLPGVYTTNALGQEQSTRLSSMAAVLKAVGPQHLFTITCTEQMYMARCTAMAAMPFVHKTTGAVEYGVSCNGCLSELEVPGQERMQRIRNVAAMAYSQEGFLRHSEECKRDRFLRSLPPSFYALLLHGVRSLG
ncbi:hypothetical protein BJY00DRAFT_47373 [Aspergillus carlsbadensis]|nr:hypothetical protein BJY00DRAFT_47373 [Aspergillus carlsbadensis]